jgi:hypothetical protein
MKDAGLKNSVKEILENCQFAKFLVDREVNINFTGATDSGGIPVSEKEIDVVARFTYGGRRVLSLGVLNHAEQGSESRGSSNLESKGRDRALLRPWGHEPRPSRPGYPSGQSV